MKNKLFMPLFLFVVTGCALDSTIATNKSPVTKNAYSVEQGVLVELQIKTINEQAIEGRFLRSIALRGHDMSSMAESHQHSTIAKDQPVNLLNELIKHGCVFKAELYALNKRLLIKKDTALFDCHEKTYVVDGELVDTRGVRGGALSLKKNDHVYFKIK